jgi:hypothetical protein
MQPYASHPRLRLSERTRAAQCVCPTPWGGASCTSCGRVCANGALDAGACRCGCYAGYTGASSSRQPSGGQSPYRRRVVFFLRTGDLCARAYVTVDISHIEISSTVVGGAAGLPPGTPARILASPNGLRSSGPGTSRRSSWLSPSSLPRSSPSTPAAWWSWQYPLHRLPSAVWRRTRSTRPSGCWRRRTEIALTRCCRWWSGCGSCWPRRILRSKGGASAATHSPDCLTLPTPYQWLHHAKHGLVEREVSLLSSRPSGVQGLTVACRHSARAAPRQAAPAAASARSSSREPRSAP